MDLPFWKYVRGLAPPVIVLAVLVGWLAYALYSQIDFWQEADEYNLREWINESRVFRKTLPDLVREYLALREAARPTGPPGGFADPLNDLDEAVRTKAEEIREHLRALGNPTRMYQGQLPLFPEIYQLEVFLPPAAETGQLSAEGVSLAWDSNLPRPTRPTGAGRIGFLEYRLLGPDDPRALMRVHYQLHAFDKRQRDEKERQALTFGVSLLAGAGVLLAIIWVYVFFKRERERALQRLIARQQIEHAEKLILEKELHRQEAEARQQAAERHALELKSQLYASIGIMAGSYAHNIKNLLVRPNDLLRRCLESDGLSPDQDQMLHEIRHTLGTVTERLQQILRTVRRDPSRSEMARIDLNAVVRDIHQTWEELAREKWKLTLTADLDPEPVLIEADLSHLQQAIENLVFNARDATFEMRNHLREQARRAADLAPDQRRQALIDAAAWRGSVRLSTRRQGDRAILEVRDNGIGMSDEVRRRCTETHFSTKRDNALYEGYTAGMGLGLSFVTVILDHHRAQLEIESAPLAGACFRACFPLASVAPASS